MRDSPARPWSNEALHERLLAIPSMLTDEERKYLIWLTRSVYTGRGAVLDLGPWLGASSASLAEGLERGGHAGVVHAFDLFRWERCYMQMDRAPDLADGDDFHPWFRRMIAPWGQRIRSAPADLTSYRWTGGPIEILFVDAAKSWALTKAILQSFGPHLMPGVTRIVLQDFADSPTYFLPLVFDAAPTAFREVEAVDIGTTVTFVVQPGADLAAVAATCDPEQFPLARSTEIFRRRAAACQGLQRSLYLGSLCYRSAEELEVAQLDALEAEIRTAYPKVTADRIQRYRDASCRLVERGWQAIQAGDLQQAASLARRALQQAPNQPWSVILSTSVALRQRDEKTFLASLQKLKSFPDQPEYLLFHAEYCSHLGDLLQAEADLLATIVLFQDRPTAVRWALGLLSSVLRRQPDLQRAWRVVQRLPAQDLLGIDFQVLCAEVALAAGHVPEASRACELVLAAEPDNTRAQHVQHSLAAKRG